MRAIVFGANGFIGTALCKRLQTCGYDIERPIEDVRSITRRDYWRYTGGLIFNLACPTTPKDYLQHPLKALLSSTQGAHVLAEIASITNSTLIHISTVRVGTEFDHLSDHAAYVEGKRCAETILREHSKVYSKIKIARLFSTFGPEMQINDSRVIPTFIRKALRNETIQIHGRGDQGDLFTYSDEVAALLVRYAVDRDAKPIVHIADPWTVSIDHLAKLILSLSLSQSKVEYIEGRAPSRMPASFDSSLIYNGSGMKMDFPQALGATIDSFKRRM